jgi:hypothetical protein
MTTIETRGFWFLMGGLVLLLILSRSYRGIVKEAKVTPIGAVRKEAV